MTIAVAVFPGTNCEADVVHAIRALGGDAEQVWHRQQSLEGATGVILPGGFAHGDYLRPGAIARFSPIMTAVAELASRGRPVLGICNGFQVLTEAGLLPGVLLQNRSLRFICRPVTLRVETTDTVMTRTAQVGQLLTIPLNSYEGNYTAEPATLEALEADRRVVLRYADAAGEPTESANPNGSWHNIAAVTNQDGTVVGLMPHPERASDPLLGSADGRVLLESFVASCLASRV